MLGDPLNVHIVTMATPFCLIYRTVPRIVDKLFVICLSIGAAIFAGYLMMAWATAGAVLLFAPLLISILSIIVGAITLLCWAYGRLMRKQRVSGQRFKRLKLARHINNQALLASGILFAAAWLLFGRHPEGILAFGGLDFDNANSVIFAAMIFSGADACSNCRNSFFARLFPCSIDSGKYPLRPTIWIAEPFPRCHKSKNPQELARRSNPGSDLWKNRELSDAYRRRNLDDRPDRRCLACRIPLVLATRFFDVDDTILSGVRGEPHPGLHDWTGLRLDGVYRDE